MLADIPERGVQRYRNPFHSESIVPVEAEPETPLRKHAVKVDESRQDSWLDRVRQGVHCSVFCGGQKCKYERWSALSPEVQHGCAIEGLNSNWVGDDVIASQRPSTSLFLKHLLIYQFKNKSVSGVVNLQEKGEHGSCGPDGISAGSGYSYSGLNDLMPNGISYYEYPWPDMTAPEHDVVLRSVQVMDYHIKHLGKVLVHCHAGLGRTGLLIACYLVYSKHMSSLDAIQLVRQSRLGAIQTEKQFKFICAFERHIYRLSQAFCVEITDSCIDVELFVRRQGYFLHGPEALLYKCTPRFLHLILCRLIYLTKKDRNAAISCLEAMSVTAAPDPKTLKRYRCEINLRHIDLKRECNVCILGFLICDWFRLMWKPALSPEACASIISFQRQCLSFGPSHSRADVSHGSESARTESGRVEPADGARVVRRLLSKTLRHTLGMVLSAVECISSYANCDVLRKRAYGYIVDSWNQSYVPMKQYCTMLERELLCEFFGKWGENIGDMYFNPDVVLVTSRTVRRIAFGSVEVMKSMDRAPDSADQVDDLDLSHPTPTSLVASALPCAVKQPKKEGTKKFQSLLLAFFLDAPNKESKTQSTRHPPNFNVQTVKEETNTKTSVSLSIPTESEGPPLTASSLVKILPEGRHFYGPS